MKGHEVGNMEGKTFAHARSRVATYCGDSHTTLTRTSVLRSSAVGNQM